MIEVIERASPNCEARPEDITVDTLVLHYTGMQTAEDALDRMCDPASKVSAHYMIDEDGTIYRLVPETKRAWHAGVAKWRGENNLNDRSIGIELVNPGHEWGYRDFPPRQIHALIDLCREIMTRHDIPAQNVVGHSDIAPTRKDDPGEKFPWPLLAKIGIGLKAEPKAAPHWGMAWVKPALETVGYDTANIHAAITAFQRHYRPDLISGLPDKATADLLCGILEEIGECPKL